MVRSGSVFKRYEKKYLLNAEKYTALMEQLAGHILPDAYPETSICSVYYDTPDYRLIRASLEKPVYKEKLRLRAYGQPGESDEAFVELKKKYKGVVYKRRVRLDRWEAEEYLAGERHPQDGQIIREIDWVMDYYRPLRPAMLLLYDREAFFGLEDPQFRITFDTNIRYRRENPDFSHGAAGIPLLEPGQRLMELKIPAAMPLWMAHILDALEIRQISFSKYGNAYQRGVLRLAEKKQTTVGTARRQMTAAK